MTKCSLTQICKAGSTFENQLVYSIISTNWKRKWDDCAKIQYPFLLFLNLPRAFHEWALHFDTINFCTSLSWHNPFSTGSNLVTMPTVHKDMTVFDPASLPSTFPFDKSLESFFSPLILYYLSVQVDNVGPCLFGELAILISTGESYIFPF